MAYILLVLGAVMSLVGLAAMITGYPAIEIERGWATVITGAVLFSGGLVVVGLGLVVRNLIGLRDALVNVGAPSALGEAPVPSAVVPAPVAPTMPAVPVASALPERPSVSHPSVPAAPDLAAAVPPAAAILAAGAGYAHDSSDAPHPAEPDPRPREASLFEEPHAEMPPAEDAHLPEIRLPEARWPEARLPEARVPAAHMPEVLGGERLEAAELRGDEHEEHAPADDGSDRQRSTQDLLDEAFSAFDYEMASGHPPAEAHPAAAHEPDAPSTGHETPLLDTLGPEHDAGPHEVERHEVDPHEAERHEVDPHEAEPHAAESHATALEHEAPTTAPEEPAANLAVIGRYDSEGTSYVMYSDGSIEAQSEAGVYRFNSMAELKAFIEG